MAFNADAMVEALEPPAFIAGGRTFRGRILSTLEWVRLHARKGELLAQSTDAVQDPATVIAATERLTRDFVVSWFPAPGILGRLVPAWANPAWRAFKRLPEKVQQELIRDFSASQRKSLPALGDPAETPAGSPPPGTETETTS